MVHMRLLWLVLGLLFVIQSGSADELSSARQFDPPHVVMLIAEREYETMQSLKRFSEDRKKAYRFTIVAEDPNDRNRLVGLDSLQTADVMCSADLYRRFNTAAEHTSTAPAAVL